MNLLCAEGLPGAEQLDVESHVRTLDCWSTRIARLTDGHLHVFRNDPATFENSEPLWRLLCISKTLFKEYGVQYHEARIDADPDWTDS